MLDTTNRVQLAFSDLDETLKTDSGNSIAALLYVDVTDVESGGCGVEDDGCARRPRTAVSTAGASPRFRTAAAALRLRLSTSAERRVAHLATQASLVWCGAESTFRKSIMPIDYRSELRRPLSLVLAGIAVLGWILALSLWLSYSNRLQASRAEAARLQQAEVTVREQLDEQRRTAGSLTDLQAKVADAQRELDQLNQAREQVQVQLTGLQQTLQTTQQQLAELQNQLPRQNNAWRPLGRRLQGASRSSALRLERSQTSVISWRRLAGKTQQRARASAVPSRSYPPRQRRPPRRSAAFSRPVKRKHPPRRKSPTYVQSGSD